MLLNILIILYTTSFIEIATEKVCSPRYYGANRMVCVCNSSYCDTIAPVQKTEPSQYVLYTTNKAGLRFQKNVRRFITNKTPKRYINVTIIDIQPEIKYQSIIGFGGAITDSVGFNIYSLNAKTREHLFRSYFSNEGLECNMVRIPMGASDYSSHVYTYDDGKPDPELISFHLAEEDLKYKIPLIKWAKQLTNNNLYLFASAWTAPKWMKTNGEYNGIGFIKKEMYQPWANYFVKFLEEYHKQGVEFWGITTGNEPTIIYFSDLISVGWLPQMLNTWIENNLGPKLRTSFIRSIRNIKLMLLDDTIILLPGAVDENLANKRVNRYVDGIAIHWYTDAVVSYDVLTQVHDNHPTKFILATEASIANVTLGSWIKAELYAIDIISDLQNWVTGWTEWNIALDLNGGPTYTSKPLDASFIVNATGNEFYKQPTFYVFGHFAKFLPRGSTRINSTLSNNNLKAVAFKRPDEGTAVVVINLNNREIPLELHDKDRGKISEIISAKSITTLLYW